MYPYCYLTVENGVFQLHKDFFTHEQMTIDYRHLKYKVLGAFVWRNFVFANNFNLPEVMQLPCVLSVERKRQFSEAQTLDAYGQYALSGHKLFTVESAVVPMSRMEYFEDFLLSPYIAIAQCAANSQEWADQWDLESQYLPKDRIFITEHDWKPVDRQGELMQLKFTFRYENPFCDPQISSYQEDRIFNDTFQIPYA